MDSKAPVPDVTSTPAPHPEAAPAPAVPATVTAQPEVHPEVHSDVQVDAPATTKEIAEHSNEPRSATPPIIDDHTSDIQRTQPEMQPEMQLHPAIKNSKNLPVDAQGHRDWNHGLCSCGDHMGTCLLACCCPCLTFGKSHSRLQTLKQTGKPHPEGGELWGPMTMLHGILTCATGCGWVLQFMLRGEIRKRYGIKGSDLGDCFTSCCCSPCEQTQLIKEIEDEEAAVRQGLITTQPASETKPEIKPEA